MTGRSATSCLSALSMVLWIATRCAAASVHPVMFWSRSRDVLNVAAVEPNASISRSAQVRALSLQIGCRMLSRSALDRSSALSSNAAMSRW